MQFNSVPFIYFFSCVTLLYFIIPAKYRWVLLLFASYYFYMSAKPEYIIILASLTIINYFLALLIEGNKRIEFKRLYLFSAITIDIAVLTAFKYINFISGSLKGLMDIFHVDYSPMVVNFILPLSISFYTFKLISYVLDVHRKKIRAERHFGFFALYVSFFPDLISGPIDRARDLLPQLHDEQKFDIQRMIDGIKLISFGLIKKIIIADRLKIFSDTVFNNLNDYNGIFLCTAVLFFGLQIYYDFSGYTDMAIGIAKILGFKLTENFNRPYFSRSIADFWRKWHISLSSWFQDYVFTPLYFKVAKLKLFGSKPFFKHLVVFSISMMIGEALLGLWHGANWTYVFFGLWHGAMIVIYYIIRKWWDRVPSYLQVLGTFTMVFIGWIFFRANTLKDAFGALSGLFTGYEPTRLKELTVIIGIKTLMILFIYIVFVEILQKIQIRSKSFLPVNNSYLRWAIYYFMILSILLVGIFNQVGFIYFGF
jgi:alginate O-acetyltransferase complex protein AlgI